ncbi:hypothetical protein ZIOFF_034805 [Zingiber officinale]|uniref:MPN domain-containing protein n=1 Tax=Zingiber officinale TaxID=94328 RepID=A0A8J5G918_ZINOF|nr:hypothetical protein ZIOFF_034805 [Zingiber officinale]
MLIVSGRIVWDSDELTSLSVVRSRPSRLPTHSSSSCSALSLSFARIKTAIDDPEGRDLLDATMVPSVDDRFPVSFYFRIADQLLKQADVYRKEGNLDCLHLTLNRYVRLVSQVIPQHRNYSKHSSKEKLRHTKILQESTKEAEKLKLLATTNINSSGSQLGRRSKNSANNFRSTSQRWTKKILNFSSFKEGKLWWSMYFLIASHFLHIVPSVNLDIVSADWTLRFKNMSKTTYFFLLFLENVRGDDNEVHVVKHYFPSSVVSWVEEGGSSGQVSHVIFPSSNDGNSKCISEGSSTSDSTKDMHIAYSVLQSVKLTEEFLDLAKENTHRDLETCGILGAFLQKNHTFYITTLIIPKQESTSNSCQALNEEEIYAILDERSLYPAGWIHTHPSQTCFLSSIDLHTQYSYQVLHGIFIFWESSCMSIPCVMLPEAIAIVLAPTDPSKGCGIFRLTDPGGIAVLKECNERDFHPHSTTADGSPIYEICSNIYTNSNLRFEIIDLRISS